MYDLAYTALMTFVPYEVEYLHRGTFVQCVLPSLQEHADFAAY